MYKSNIVLEWRRTNKGNNTIGAKCKKCSTISFPFRKGCIKCSSTNVEDYPFKGTGEIYSFSTIYYPPAGLEKQVPYVIAMIKLDEGPKMTAQLVDFENVEIGMRVESCIRKLHVDGESGIIHYGVKFRPAD